MDAKMTTENDAPAPASGSSGFRLAMELGALIAALFAANIALARVLDLTLDKIAP